MSLNDSLKAAPCATCRHCVYRQCARTWPDATSTGVVERVIRVDPKAHGFPAHHVHRFWCAKADGSRGYQSGISAATGPLSLRPPLDFYNQAALLIKMGSWTKHYEVSAGAPSDDTIVFRRVGP